MLKINVQARDKEVKSPASKVSLFDLKSRYLCTNELSNEDINALFDLVDFLTDRLLLTESERFRNNY